MYTSIKVLDYKQMVTFSPEVLNNVLNEWGFCIGKASYNALSVIAEGELKRCNASSVSVRNASKIHMHVIRSLQISQHPFDAICECAFQA